MSDVQILSNILKAKVSLTNYRHNFDVRAELGRHKKSKKAFVGADKLNISDSMRSRSVSIYIEVPSDRRQSDPNLVEHLKNMRRSMFIYLKA